MSSESRSFSGIIASLFSRRSQQKKVRRAVLRQALRIESLEVRTVFAAFTPGNLVVYRVGDGTTALANTGNSVFLDEYTPSGTLVQSLPLPSTGAGNRLIASGTATSEGLLNISSDGQFLVLTGYNATAGGTYANGAATTTSLTASTTSSTGAGTAVLRTIGSVGADGSIDVSTTTTSFSANNVRSATRDGNNFWASGANTGVITTPVGGSGPGTIVSNTVTNLRDLEIANGQLYASSGSGTTRVVTVGTGAPLTTGQTATNLPGFATAGSPYQFFFTRLGTGTASNGFDTLYVADDTASTGGIQKWSFNGSAWSQNGTLTGATSVRGLTGVKNANGSVTLYGTTGSAAAGGGGSLYVVTDASGFNATISGTVATVASVTSTSNLAFRGIAFAADDGIGAVTGLGGTTNYTAGNAAIIVAGAAAFSDLSNFKGGSLNIAYVSGGTANDTLAIKNVGTGSGQIGVSGSTISFGGTTIGTIDATSNGASGAALKINFNAVSAASADVLSTAIQALMRQVTFNSTSGATGGNRALSFQVTQNDGKASTINAASTQTVVVTGAAGNQAPVFDATGPFSVAENSASGTAVGTVTAHDPDVGQTISFAAIGSGTGSALFSISSSGAITVSSGANLDFEVTKSYTFGVRVTDNGTPAQSTDAVITINLTDVNEAPVFPSGTITRSLVAGSANGTAVTGGAVTATDPDVGDSVASYQIVGGNGTGGGAFAISNTGVLTVANASQVASTGSFTLLITATDTQNLSSAAKSVTVNVVANSVPVFSPTSYAFGVAENSASNTNVGTPITATDADSASGDTITYSIVTGNGTGGGAFKINATTGQIQVNTATQLDFETTPTFTLTVRATDSFGEFGADATVTINLTNVVEAPSIPAGQAFTIAENTANGVAVGTVAATFDSTATKSFSITAGNGTGGAFAISSTGQITVADSAQIDYESVPNHSFSLTVQATDTANNLSATRTVTVNLTNVHEGTLLTPGDILVTGFDATGTDEFSFIPVVALAAGTEIRFTDNGWLAAGGFRANEGNLVYVAPAGGLAAGREVGITSDGAGGVTVVGPGTAFNETGGSTFALNTGGDQLIVFQGTIANPTPIFALTTNRDTFETDATSASTTALPTGLVVGTSAIALGTSSAATANAEYNDSARIGTASGLQALISNSANWTKSGTRITLTYRDFTLADVTTSWFINEVVFNPFNTTDTGEEYIELRGTPNAFIQTDTYLVLLDGDSEDNNGNIDHIFYIGGMQFGSNGFLVLLQAGSTYTVNPASTKVTASGTGWGTGFSSIVTDIENGSESVLIVSTSIAPQQDTDVDVNDDAVLDGAAAAAGSTWIIRDALGNIDGGASDTAYGFFNTTGSTTGAGIVPPGSTFITIPNLPAPANKAYHPDYMARNGNSTGNALADWVFGELAGLMPNATLATGGFAFPTAFEGAALNHLGSTNTFASGNRAPTDIALSKNTIAENAGADASVGTFTTADPDSGNTFVYTLVTGTGSTDNAAFNISGAELRANASFNFESKSSYSVRVRTTDQGSLFFEKSFTITVTDVNENPVFSPTTYTFNVPENSPTGTVVGTVSATDPDAGASLTYTLLGVNSNKFVISPTTGQITVTAGADLNFEGTNLFSLTASVTDGQLTATAPVTINVTNVNETPVFAPPSYTFILPENSPAGTTVGTVTATDPESNTLTYALSGAGSSNFIVNASTGAITVATGAVLDFEGVKTFNLTARVSDGNSEGTAPVTINLTNVNEVPSFTSNNSFSVAEANTNGLTGPSSSATPYLTSTNANVQFTSILTVGDSIGGYKMVGIPDGLGAFDNGDGTITLLMNQELGNTVGATRAHGGIGAFVSKWIIRKSDLTVLSGSDLMRSVLDGGTNAALTGAALNFSRFCSADLPTISAFYNSATGLGTQERIFLNGEENGNGRALANIVTGPNAGTSYTLPLFSGIGASWENLLANPATGNQTLVAANNDTAGGKVYFYLGTKQSTGNEIQKAGLLGGTLYQLAVTGVATESRTNGFGASSPTFTGNFTLSTGAGTGFLRPEDGAWDPANPNDYYFVTTDQLDNVQDGNGAQVGRSRLYRAHFNDLANPTAGGTIEAILDGTEGGNMFDNLTVAGGIVTLQEDVGNAEHLGKVWQYNIASDTLTQVAQHDRARFGDVGLAATSPFTQDEESSGVVDVSSIFGPGTYLLDVQAHYPTGDSTTVEGGQLLFMRTNVTTAPKLVTAVTASDPEADTLTYAIAGGADAAKFTIDPASGRLSFVTTPNFESPTDAGSNNVYDVTVSVNDGVNTPVTQAIQVVVTAVNETPSNTTANRVNVPENSTAVTTVSGTDPEGATLIYAISGGADAAKFSINPNSGALSFVTAPNFESPTDNGANNSYFVTVTVSDSVNAPVNKTVVVTVTNITELSGIDVQKGQTQRSFVRNVDVLFDQGGAFLNDLLSNSRLQLTRFDLNGTNGVVVPIPSGTVAGNQIQIDFGVQGIGGNRNTNAGDGYYEIAMDMDGNGSFETKQYFHRILGDISGDGTVDNTDKARVLAAQGGAYSVEDDVNGDGVVNAADTSLLTRAFGRKLKDGLPRND